MKDNELLKNRVALVTGGAGGIGSAICKKFAEEGSAVCLHYNKNEKNALAIKEGILEKSQRCEVFKADLADSIQIKKMFQEIKEKYSDIDILVNNAAITLDALVVMTSEEQFDKLININLRSCFLCSKKFIYNNLKAKRPGIILNVSSVAGYRGAKGMGIYALTKAAINSFTRTLAQEYADKDIRVNAISPGPVDTNLMKGMPENLRQKLLNEVPLGRVGKPDEIAELALFLCSEKSRFITGSIMSIDGGQSA